MNWIKSPTYEIESIYSLTLALKHPSVMVRVVDNYASDVGSIPDQVCELLVNFILLDSSN